MLLSDGKDSLWDRRKHHEITECIEMVCPGANMNDRTIKCREEDGGEEEEQDFEASMLQDPLSGLHSS